MAVVDINRDIALDRFGVVGAAAEEIVDISIVYLPADTALDAFLRCSCRLMEITTTDIAFSIIFPYRSVRIVGASEIESRIFTSRNRYRHVRCRLTTITMGAQTE